MQKDAMIERMGKAMAEADLWPGAWDGNMPHGYAMSDAEKNAWVARADAGFDTVAPLIAAAEREACAKYHDEAADGERDLASQCGAQNDRQAQKLHQWLEQEHILSAAAIRARSDAP